MGYVHRFLTANPNTLYAANVIRMKGMDVYYGCINFIIIAQIFTWNESNPPTEIGLKCLLEIQYFGLFYNRCAM